MCLDVCITPREMCVPGNKVTALGTLLDLALQVLFLLLELGALVLLELEIMLGALEAVLQLLLSAVRRGWGRHLDGVVDLATGEG